MVYQRLAKQAAKYRRRRAPRRVPRKVVRRKVRRSVQERSALLKRNNSAALGVRRKDLNDPPTAVGGIYAMGLLRRDRVLGYVVARYDEEFIFVVEDHAERHTI